MKKHLLVVALGLGITACSKAEEENDVTPAAITAAFDQDFNLNYRQQATISSSSQTELAVAVEDLQYGFCPKSAYCFIADFVNPTISVTDIGGQTQHVKLPVVGRTNLSYNWIDSASVRANGKRYVLYYMMYEVKAERDNPEKKDISVKLHIAKSVNN